jgi:hypothetical protein
MFKCSKRLTTGGMQAMVLQVEEVEEGEINPLEEGLAPLI